MAGMMTVNALLDLMRRTANGTADGLDAIYTACKYPAELTTADFVNMYEREGIPARVVDIWPDECWADAPEVWEDDDTDTDTDFEEKLKTVIEEKRLWRVLHEVDRLSGVGEYGGVYISISGDSSVEALVRPPANWPEENSTGTNGLITFSRIENELPPAGASIPENGLLFLRPLSQNNMKVDAIETNILSPRYGLPTVYSVQFGGETNTTSGSGGVVTVDSNTYKIHWTRIVHIPSDGSGANPTVGRPRMKRVFNRLLDLVKAYGGSAQSLWNGGFPGISFETAPGFEDAEVENPDELKKQMADYADGFRRWIWARGLTANQLQPGITDPSPFVEVYLQNIGATIGVPWRKLLGSEQGQLASGQDGETWDKRVDARRRERCDKDILRPVLRRLVWLGCLPVPEQIRTEWKTRVEPKPSEVAAVAKIEAEVLAMYVEKDIAQVVPPAEFLELVLHWDKNKVEQVQTAAGSFQDFERLRKATHDAAVKGAEQLAKGEPANANDKATGGPAAAPPAAGPGKAPPKPATAPRPVPRPVKAPAKK